MPKYRFNLPINMRRADVDNIISDARALRAVSNTTPWFKLLTTDSWQYQIVIHELAEEDAFYLILKHSLIVVRNEIDAII